MIKEGKHFLFLIMVMSLGLVGYLVLNYNRPAQIKLTAALGITYFLWGIIYHASRKELHLKIILEYLLVALLGSLMVIFLLWRT